jgi:hypothetical protein
MVPYAFPAGIRAKTPQSERISRICHQIHAQLESQARPAFVKRRGFLPEAEPKRDRMMAGQNHESQEFKATHELR